MEGHKPLIFQAMSLFRSEAINTTIRQNVDMAASVTGSAYNINDNADCEADKL